MSLDCKEKLRYPTEEEAKEEVRKLNLIYRSGRKDPYQARKCRDCGGWHWHEESQRALRWRRRRVRAAS